MVRIPKCFPSSKVPWVPLDPGVLEILTDDKFIPTKTASEQWTGPLCEISVFRDLLTHYSEVPLYYSRCMTT